MSFREKSAWISLVTILVVTGFFFVQLHWALTRPSSPQLLRGLLYWIVALVLIEVMAHTVVALRTPEDAKARRDERERLIDLKATRIGYFVYVAASLLAVSTIHLGADTAEMGYSVLLAFVLATLVRHAARIVYHRRGI